VTDHALLPEHDVDVPAFWQLLDLPGLLDVHVHFLPKPIMDRVWEHFAMSGPTDRARVADRLHLV
jgi:hypothetical protein